MSSATADNSYADPDNQYGCGSARSSRPPATNARPAEGASIIAPSTAAIADAEPLHGHALTRASGKPGDTDPLNGKTVRNTIEGEHELADLLLGGELPVRRLGFGTMRLTGPAHFVP